jgi:hypothetical protein
MPLAIGPYDQYVLAAVVLAGTAAAVVCLLWLTQRSPFAPFIGKFRGIAQNFLTVINVIFALNLAFLANDTWNAHDRALSAVFREAGSLATIRDLGQHLPPPERQALDNAVHAFVAVTVGTEWPLLGRRESSPQAAATLDNLMCLIASPGLAAALPSGSHALMLREAAEVRAMRDQRIALSQTHVNPLKWLGMAFLGLLTIISIAMVHVDHPRAEFLAVLLFAVAAAPTAALILIHGNPFQQPTAVSAAPLQAILDGTPMTGPT